MRHAIVFIRHHVAAVLFAILALIGAVAAIPCAYAETAASLHSVTTPRGVKQAFILLKPDRPVAAVILFAGGHGGLGLTGPKAMKWGAQNFLVRTREQFAAQSLMVAVVDAPADHSGGMNAVFRFGAEHAADIAAVSAFLKTQANVPVWMVGTSMGTFSAARAAFDAKAADGVVLTSTITRAKPEWKIASSHADGVASLPLDKITAPVLILSHRKDGCDITPAGDAPKLTRRLTRAKKVETALLEGGSPPISAPCEARSEHGFLGIESQAVARIAAFIKANSPQ
jgi:pimeloyl-ACP methyl ester carboxylesterase